MRRAKVVFLGTSGVGKTSILNRFVSEEFDTEVNPTVWGLNQKKTLNLTQGVVQLVLWDTAGQEKFRSVSKSYVRCANAVIVVASYDSRLSFETLNEFKVLVEENAPEAMVYVVANKVDLVENQREVNDNEARAMAQEAFPGAGELHYLSAKTGNGVEALFERIGYDFLESAVEAEPEVLVSNPRQEKQCC